MPSVAKMIGCAGGCVFWIWLAVRDDWMGQARQGDGFWLVAGILLGAYAVPMFGEIAEETWDGAKAWWKQRKWGKRGKQSAD